MRTSLAVLTTLLVATTSLSGCSDEVTAAAFTATPMTENKSQYKFDASASTGSGLSFIWDFGDQTEPMTGKVVEHTFQYLNGDYKVVLTVKDKSGVEDKEEQAVPVGNGPNTDPLLFLQADYRLVTPNEQVTFDATQSYDADGDPLRFQWDFNSPLSETEFRSYQNLGSQQYGRYKYGPPPGGAGNNSTSNPGGGGESGSAVTPSGHVWLKEFEAAKKRALERAGVGDIGFHGTASGPEPRNPDFDGRTDDSSPIQIFAFPSPATYYVFVKLYDIKGALAEGYIRIRVATTIGNRTDSPPPVVDQPLSSGRFKNQDGDQVHTTYFWTHLFLYTAQVEAKLTFTKDPDGTLPVESSMAMFACGAQKSAPECPGTAKATLAAGASGRTFYFNITPTETDVNWKILVSNEGDAPVKFTLAVFIRNDINPWILQEMGLEQGG